MTDEPTTHVKHSFRVMGTDAELMLRTTQPQAAPLFAAAESSLHKLSARLTRFDSASELEQLNDRGHGRVTGVLRTILEYSLQQQRETDGRFDIGIGADLIAAGYDRTFDSIATPSAETASRRAAPAPPARPAPRRSFTIDEAGDVRIRPGARLDLGGIAKGWASDLTCARLAQEANASCLVSLGGDIAVHVIDGDDPWPIGVQLEGIEASLGLSFGGLATSGQDRRVWEAPDGSGLAHHVIDPRTGRPAATDVIRITIIERSSMVAEVWAKALMIDGFDAAVAEATRRSLATVIVGTQGRVRGTGALESLIGEYLREG